MWKISLGRGLGRSFASIFLETWQDVGTEKNWSRIFFGLNYRLRGREIRVTQISKFNESENLSINSLKVLFAQQLLIGRDHRRSWHRIQQETQGMLKACFRGNQRSFSSPTPSPKPLTPSMNRILKKGRIVFLFELIFEIRFSDAPLAIEVIFTWSFTFIIDACHRIRASSLRPVWVDLC